MTIPDARPRWWERLNRALFPVLGPAQLSEFGAPSPPASGQPCPLCGTVMSTHTVERPGGNASSRLRCPAV